jgi:hypothetical protein
LISTEGGGPGREILRGETLFAERGFKERLLRGEDSRGERLFEKRRAPWRTLAHSSKGEHILHAVNIPTYVDSFTSLYIIWRVLVYALYILQTFGMI